MNRNVLLFIALAVTIITGALYNVVGDENRGIYAAVAGPIVALTWIGFGMFGRDDDRRQRQD